MGGLFVVYAKWGVKESLGTVLIDSLPLYMLR